MSAAYVVLHDPRGKWTAGAMVDPAMMRHLQGYGVLMLPVEPDLLDANALAGLYWRQWGAGWVLPETTPGRVCPMALHMVPEAPLLHWCARLEVDKTVTAADRAGGVLRLVGDSAQGFRVLTVQGPTVDFGSLDADQHVHHVAGTVRVSPDRGLYGFALYGAARGVRVVAAAISQTMD